MADIVKLTIFDIPKFDSSVVGRRDNEFRIKLKARHSRLMLIGTLRTKDN